MRCWLLAPLSLQTDVAVYVHGPMGVDELRQFSALLALALHHATGEDAAAPEAGEQR